MINRKAEERLGTRGSRHGLAWRVEERVDGQLVGGGEVRNMINKRVEGGRGFSDMIHTRVEEERLGT